MTTDQPNIRAESHRYKKHVRQRTVPSTTQGTTRHMGPRAFLPSFPLSKSLKQPRHNAEICFTLLYALLPYLKFIFQKCGKLQLMFLQTDVTGKQMYSTSYICVYGQADVTPCTADMCVCVCVCEGGLQAFTTSALKSGHFHTVNALLSGTYSSAIYTGHKTCRSENVSQYIGSDF
jgi:hypothetical protein